MTNRESVTASTTYRYSLVTEQNMIAVLCLGRAREENQKDCHQSLEPSGCSCHVDGQELGL